MPKVLNKRTDGIPPGAVYVGRPSKWGNPFHIGYDGSREEVIAKFREWAYAPEQREWRRRLRTEAGGGVPHVCWCAPEPCHAELTWEIANSEED